MADNIQEIAKLITENDDLKGTFIDELIQVMALGEFVEINNDVNEETQTVVGEMNSLEKAVNTLINRYSESEKRIVKIFRKAMKHGKEIDVNEERAMNQELRSIRKRYEVAEPLKWSAIYDRFANHDGEEIKGWGICSGFKVVKLHVNGENESDDCELGEKLALMAIFGCSK